MNFLFVGPLNVNNHPVGGDQYKNQLLAEYFDFQQISCNYIDTNLWQYRPLTIIKLLYCIIAGTYDRIILSVSAGSAYKFILFLNLFPEKLKKTVYLVIGGDLTSKLSSGIFSSKYYSNLLCIGVEGEKLKQELLLMGLLNAEMVPNFKRIPLLPGIPNRSKYPVNFVFLSRVTPSKGVTLIFEAVKLLNTNGYSDSFTVTFFGPLDHKFETTLKDGLNQQLVYGGVLDLMNAPAEMYEKLASYNCMLFPTYWEGEGFPGVIIDAFIAGLPVIASDWNMNKELIHDGVNGLIIQPINPLSLAEAMKTAIDNPDLLKQLSDNARMRAKDYDIEKIGQQILQILGTPPDEKTEVSVSVE